MAKKKVSKKQEVFVLNKETPFVIKEAYKDLRTSIRFSLPGSGCKTILVTSADKQEAKSTTAINLAITMGEQQSRVLLMDCDLRLPSTSLKLRLPQKPGISNLLVDINKIEDCIQHPNLGFDFLPAGDIPPNPSELLDSEQMRTFLNALSRYYDYIIIDAPPACVVTDPVILSKHVSGVIMVARQGVASRESINAAINKLKFAGAKILGFVYTDVKFEKNSKYGKGYYGYYR